MKKTIGNYTLNTPGSSIIIRNNGELVNIKEGNPNDMKTSFNERCDLVSKHVMKLRASGKA
jgi:hypothetical protein